MQFCMTLLHNLQQSSNCRLLSGSLGHPNNTYLAFPSLHHVLTQVSLSLLQQHTLLIAVLSFLGKYTVQYSRYRIVLKMHS